MSQQTRYCCHIRAVGDEQACVGVPEGMHIQIFRQTVFLEDLLEPEGEGGGSHWKLGAVAAEYEVILGQRPLVVGFRFPSADFLELQQERCHLRGEVHISVARGGLRQGDGA